MYLSRFRRFHKYIIVYLGFLFFAFPIFLSVVFWHVCNLFIGLSLIKIGVRFHALSVGGYIRYKFWILVPSPKRSIGLVSLKPYPILSYVDCSDRTECFTSRSWLSSTTIISWATDGNLLSPFSVYWSVYVCFLICNLFSATFTPRSTYLISSYNS